MLEIIAYTDGACSGNPGPGGWGVLLRAIKGTKIVKERELHGGEANTTNNRMELMAAIKALETLTGSMPIKIYTDSRYVRDGVTNWKAKWKKNGWKTANKRPVKNLDLWKRLDAAECEHNITWEWIKGHAGHEGNERADWLARAGRASLEQKN